MTVDSSDWLDIQYMTSSSRGVLCRQTCWKRWSFWQCKCSCTIMLKIWPGWFDDFFGIWNVSYGRHLVVFSARFLLCRMQVLNTLPHLQKVVLAMVPTCMNGSGLGLEPEPNHCNGLYHPNTRTVAILLVLSPTTRHFNITILASILNLSSDLIVTWSVYRLCSPSCCFTSRFKICHLTIIRWVTMENPGISVRICPEFTDTHRISVGSQICNREVKEQLDLHNLHTAHAIIRSELKYLIGAKDLGTV